ncbi:peptidoglycan-binding protein [Phormidium tenue FACHB-886]|nr:peptidoglycan-binding protein [Phormidium tenue FACHB-886]
MQRFLVLHAHLKSTTSNGSVHSTFDIKMSNAVVEFQQFHGIQPANGQVGAYTWNAIAYPADKTPEPLNPIASIHAVLPTVQTGNYGSLMNVLQRLLVIYS